MLLARFLLSDTTGERCDEIAFSQDGLLCADLGVQLGDVGGRLLELDLTDRIELLEASVGLVNLFGAFQFGPHLLEHRLRHRTVKGNQQLASLEGAALRYRQAVDLCADLGGQGGETPGQQLGTYFLTFDAGLGGSGRRRQASRSGRRLHRASHRGKTKGNSQCSDPPHRLTSICVAGLSWDSSPQTAPRWDKVRVRSSSEISSTLPICGSTPRVDCNLASAAWARAKA